MNIGVYIESLQNATPMISIMNKWASDESDINISLFYDDIGYVSENGNFGYFNSTDIWHFTGNLLLTSANCFNKIKKVINKFKPLFIFKHGDGNIFTLIEIVKTMPVIVTSQEDYDYIKRISGESPHLLEELTPSSIQEVYSKYEYK